MELTAQDRCDRCGARATAKATKPGNTELLFCDHHTRQHHDALIEQYWLVEKAGKIVTPNKVAALT